jgi:mannose-6-phosphate isomerase-like protein (cupin superfamily)
MAPRIIGPKDGKYVDFDGLGVRFMAWAEETGGGFSLVEHPIEPRALCAPLHRHSREDEYSFVVEGRMGAQLGDDVLVAETGDFVFKPRDQWHTFWNPDHAPCRILEIISPGGFERYFDELGETLASVDISDQEAVGAAIGQLGARYGLEFDPESIPRICAEHGLSFRG